MGTNLIKKFVNFSLMRLYQKQAEITKSNKDKITNNTQEKINSQFRVKQLTGIKIITLMLLIV